MVERQVGGGETVCRRIILSDGCGTHHVLLLLHVIGHGIGYHRCANIGIASERHAVRRTGEPCVEAQLLLAGPIVCPRGIPTAFVLIQGDRLVVHEVGRASGIGIGR